MGVNKEKYGELSAFLNERNVTLVAVSKIKPVEDIMALYELGHRDFGENYVQELVDKQARLPQDIRWHFIGHLQTNKVKYIAPFVHLVHGIDSVKLLKEVSKNGIRNNKVIHVLLQVHIAKEETKFGFDENEISALVNGGELKEFTGVKVKGLMGMASFSDDQDVVKSEFVQLKKLFDSLKDVAVVDAKILSMGMSGDYEMAIEQGSNMVRIGSLLFGAR
jgi:PLP dependent protein